MCAGTQGLHFTDNWVPGLLRSAWTHGRLLCLGCTWMHKCCMVQCCCVSLWVSRLPCAVHRQRPVDCTVWWDLQWGRAAQQICCCASIPSSCLQVQHPLPRYPPIPHCGNPSQLGSPWTSGLGFLAELYHHLSWFSPVFKAHEEEVRKKFRPIEQLKEEFEKLNVKMETDYEIMDKLISKFNSSASTLDEKVAALYDLEYYVHQVTKTHLYLPCKIQGLRYHKCGFIFLISIR